MNIFIYKVHMAKVDAGFKSIYHLQFHVGKGIIFARSIHMLECPSGGTKIAEFKQNKQTAHFKPEK